MARRRRARRFFVLTAATAAVVLAVPFAQAALAVGRELTAKPLTADTRLHVDVVGQGELVVAIHGLAGSGRYFSTRSWGLEGHRLLAPDLLGFGRSDKPDARYDLEEHARLVADAIAAEAEPGERPVLVGHSLGALIALELLRRSPDRYAGAVLVGTPVFEGADDAARRLDRLSPMFGGMVREDAWVMASCFFRDSYRLPFLAPLFDLPEDVYLDGTRHSWSSLSRTLRAIVATDVDELVAGVTAPLVFVHGAADDTADPERARRLAARVGAPFVLVEGVGHQLFLDEPGVVWTRVEALASR